MTQPPASAAAAVPARRQLVWLTSTKNQPAATFVVRGDQVSGCRFAGPIEGVWLSATSHLFRWREGRDEIPAPGYAAAGDESGSVIGWGVLTDAVSSAVRRFEWAEDRKVAGQQDVGPASAGMPNQVDSTVHLEASFGPLLVILHSGYRYQGGAHGFSSTELELFDLARGGEVPLGSLRPPEAAWQSVRERAAATLAKDTPGDAVAPPAGPPKPIGLLPLFDHQARLHPGYVFAQDACYACSHGPWTLSYAVTVRLDGPLPSRLRAYAKPPECLRALAQAHQETEIGGWGEIGPSAHLRGVIDRWLGDHGQAVEGATPASTTTHRP